MTKYLGIFFGALIGGAAGKFLEYVLPARGDASRENCIANLMKEDGGYPRHLVIQAMQLLAEGFPVEWMAMNYYDAYLPLLQLLRGNTFVVGGKRGVSLYH